jgi:hypothetical protein
MHSTNLPDYMPEYAIEWVEEAPFVVRYEEIEGWFLIPRPGERVTWGIYDMPERRRTSVMEMEAVGKIEVHGIQGVELRAVEYDEEAARSSGREARTERTFAAQLTDEYVRFLAESHLEDGVRRCVTFLDGGPFMDFWRMGRDNCGLEVEVHPRGILRREGGKVRFDAGEGEPGDVVGRCRVTLGGREFDAICLMDFWEDTATETYIGRDGRTMLSRRFNRNDWQAERRGKRWTELLPWNERLGVNGETYVHWYDCISDCVL